MKKFGTPIGAGPGVESAKVGFEGAGAPVEVVSFGVSTLTFFSATGFFFFFHP